MAMTGAVMASEAESRRITDPTMQVRFGLDTNPQAANGVEAEHTNHWTQTWGVGLGVVLLPEAAGRPTAKLTYAAEVARFSGLAEEDYAQHRLGLSGRWVVGGWTLTADGSVIWVDGSRDTLVSVATVNANGLSLWRERRRQWQHRGKLQALREWGRTVVRVGGTGLNYDFGTRFVAGRVPFADRSDRQAIVEVGWKRSADSLWLAGARAGRQEQAPVPLPNCEFEYSADYRRLTLGWEGRLPGNTTVAWSAGPDFRRFTGAIDPRVFTGGRDRTSLWLEGSVVSKVTSRCTVTGRITRMSWLSSTGKSALMDTSAEMAAMWTINPAWTWRAGAKAHHSDYFPSVRDDWESLFSTGVILKITGKVQVTADLLRHRGWGAISGLAGRDFQRTTFALGASARL